MTGPPLSQSSSASSPSYATSAYGEPTSRPAGPVSGLTEEEAQGFHKAFTMSFLGFLAIAIVAHILVWQWRPWIPGAAGYPTRTAQTAPAVQGASATLQLAAVTSSTR